jgi:niacin transporter
VKNQRNKELAISGLLVATSIIIPLFSPFKIVLEPASFTLASHVPIFLAMFISPRVTASVAIGSALGFLIAGFPLVIVLRAATHLIFALLGAYYLKKYPLETMSVITQRIFSLCIGAIHALCEVVVVGAFYFAGSAGSLAGFGQEFVISVLALVGLGTVVHSMFDFEIARFLDLRLHLSQKFR